MELQQSKIMADIRDVENKLSESISSIVTQAILAENNPASQTTLPTGLKKDLNSISAKLDKVQATAQKEKKDSDEKAQRSEEEIKKTQDKIADCQIKKKKLEEKRSQLAADQTAAQTEYSSLQQETQKLRSEIENLSHLIAAAEERERVRNILIWIPIINIGAAIESACSDDKDKIRQRSQELEVKARALNDMEERINALTAEIKSISDQTAKLDNDLSGLQTQLVQTVQLSLESKNDMVMWSRVLEYFAMLGDRLGRLIRNSACDDDLLAWLDTQQSAVQTTDSFSLIENPESELGRLKALVDQARTAMNRTPFYSGGALYSDQFDDLTDDTDSCWAFPDGLQIRCGDIIDGIRFRYNTADTPVHGGQGGSLLDFALAQDEFIVKAEGRWGPYWNNSFLHFLCFTTNKGRRLSGGTETGGGSAFVTEVPDGHAICGIYGETAHPVEGKPLEHSSMLSGIGFYTRPLPAEGRR